MIRLKLWAILWIALSCFKITAQNCTATWVATNVTCNGSNDGSINVTPSGGVAPYTMTWPNNGFGFTLLGLSAGCYQGTLMDANNCTTQITICITQPPALTVSIVPNGNDLVAVASGGTPPYSYSWPNFGYTTSTISPTIAGIYTVQVVDANGCMAQSTATWSQALYNTFFNGTVNIDCDQDGQVDSTLLNVPVSFNVNGAIYHDTVSNAPIVIGLSQPELITINVENSWLMANGYSVQSISPSPVNVNPTTTIPFTVNLICDTSAQNLSVSGMVFCDGNGNGLQDAGEAPLCNAPIIATMNGSQVMTYSNANGNYALTMYGNPFDTMQFTIAPNYITYSGITSPQVLQLNLSGWNNNLIQTLNFPLSCYFNGATPYTYQGYVFCDANNNGSMENNESPMINAPVHLIGDIGNYIINTDSTGFFSYTGSISSNATVSAFVQPSYLQAYNYGNIPAQTIIGSLNNQSTMGYFAVNCSPCTNLTAFLTNAGNYFQGNTTTMHLYWGLNGPTQCNSYTLKLLYPSNVSPILNSIVLPNYSISGDTIIWQLTTTSPNQNTTVQFLLPSGITTNLTQAYGLFISPNCGMQDCQPANNNFSIFRTLGNSYDPNIKHVIRSQNTQTLFNGLNESFIDGNTQEELDYTIEFQNTGTAPAQNIYIIDTLASILDVSSLSVYEFSHPVQTTFIGDHIVRFDFNQIWLLDSTTNEPESHGYVRYRIQEGPVLTTPALDTIDNTAYIYFDWNEAIVTNTTHNVNVVSSNSLVENTAKQFIVFPNPGNDVLNLGSDDSFEYVITDVFGRMITNGYGQKSVGIATTTWANGTYIISLNANYSSSTVKWIKTN